MTDLQNSPVIPLMPFYWSRIQFRITCGICHASWISFTWASRNVWIQKASTEPLECAKTVLSSEDSKRVLAFEACLYFIVKIKIKSKVRHGRIYWILLLLRKKKHCLHFFKIDTIKEDDPNPKVLDLCFPPQKRLFTAESNFQRNCMQL